MKKLLYILVLATAIQGACFAQEAQIQLTEKENCVKQILANDYKYTPLGFFSAINNGDARTVDLFLKSGMDPNTIYMKVSALFFAVTSKQPEVVEVLLDGGANPNAQFGGITPLVTAIKYDQTKIVQSLVAHGANVNQVANFVVPLNYAIQKKNVETVKCLLNAGAIVTDDALVDAVRSKNNEIKNLTIKNYKIKE